MLLALIAVDIVTLCSFGCHFCQQQKQLGTVVMLHCDDLFQELWKSDLNVIRMDDGTAFTRYSNNGWGYAARQFEIWIDLIASQMASSSHFLLGECWVVIKL